MLLERINRFLPFLIFIFLPFDKVIFILAAGAVFVYLILNKDTRALWIPLFLLFTESDPVNMPLLKLTFSKWGFAFLMAFYIWHRPKFKASAAFIPASIFFSLFLLWTAFTWDGVIIRWTVTMAANLLLFFILFQLMADRRLQKIIIKGLLAALCINALLAIFQFISGGHTILEFGLNNDKGLFEYWGSFVRVSGFFQNTNLFVSFIIPLSLILFPFIEKRYRWYLLIPAAAALFTFSRGALVAVGGALIILIIKKGRKFLPALIILLLVIFFSPFGARFFGKAPDRSVYYSDLGRKASFQVASDFIKRKPWKGIGPGKFYEEFSRYAPQNLPWENFYPHNAFISSLGETGIAGLTALLALFFVLLAIIKKTRAEEKEKWFASSLFSLFLLSNFYDLHTEPQFWLIAAFISAIPYLVKGGVPSDSV